MTLARSSLLLIIALGGCSADTAEEPTKANPATVDTYHAGIEKVGEAGLVKLAIDSALPAPPAKADNEWVVSLRHVSGPALDNAQLNVVPFMPEHGHGSSKKPVVTPLGAGRYRLAPVNFMMPGLWETTIQINLADKRKDKVVFRFMIAD